LPDSLPAGAVGRLGKELRIPDFVPHPSFLKELQFRIIMRQDGWNGENEKWKTRKSPSQFSTFSKFRDFFPLSPARAPTPPKGETWRAGRTRTSNSIEVGAFC